jgi:autotransporter-associated beta strand protein
MSCQPRASTGANPSSSAAFRARCAGWAGRGALLAICLAFAAQIQAADLYWDGGASPSTLWTTASNWDTAAGGGGGNPGAAPGVNDVATFNVSTLNAATTATLGANLSVQGMVFNNTGSTAINTDGGANRTITLGTSGLTLNAGAGTVTFGTVNNTQRIAFSLAGSQSWTNNSSNTLAMLPNNVGTNLNLGGFALTFAGSGNITTGKGIISGSGGSIIKNGAGSLTLGTSDAGAQTFTGGVTLNAGTLTLGAASALGTGALTINGGTIDVLVSNTTPNNNAQNWNGNFTFAGTNTWNTGTGAVTMNASRQVTVNSSTMTVGGVIGESSSGAGLTKAGAGTLSLSAANTFTGLTQPLAGSLVVAGTFALQNSTLDMSTSGSGSVVFNQNSTLGGLTGSRNLNLNARQITVGNNGSSTTYSGVLSNGSLVKTGTGSLVLSNANTFTGPTTVSAGSLLVNGSLANSAVTVQSGGLLGGSGVLGGAIGGAGVIAPGNSAGILTAPSVSFDGGLDFAFEFGQAGAPTWSSAVASGNDVLRLTDSSSPLNTATAANVFDIYFLEIGQNYLGGIFTDRTSSFETAIAGATFNYFVRDNAGAISYGGFQYSPLSAGQVTRSTLQVTSAGFSGGTVSNGYTMQFVVVPEPGAIALAVIGIATAACAFRRRT